MKKGDLVPRFSYDGLKSFVTIAEVNVFCPGYDCPFVKTSKGAIFHAVPDPETGRHYNKGNKAFWLKTLP